MFDIHAWKNDDVVNWSWLVWKQIARGDSSLSTVQAVMGLFVYASKDSMRKLKYWVRLGEVTLK